MSEMASQRIAPHQTEAEQSVLGAMMLDQAAVAAGAEALTPEDFYSPAHRELFEAMMTLYNSGRPVDLVTVLEVLGQRGSVEGVGGIAYVTDLSRFVPTTANVKHYIEIVKQKSTLRKLIDASGKIMADSYEASKEVAEILNDAEKAIFTISMGQGEKTVRHVKDALVETYEMIETAYRNQGGLTGIATGFTDLDQMLSGLHADELILVAARPSMGKTSFVMNIVQDVAVRQKIPVAVFSLEMSATQLTNRLLCSEAGVDMSRARDGRLTPDDWRQLAMAMGVLSQAPLYIDDTPGITVTEMRSKCRRMKMDTGLGMVVIDYLQLMSASGGRRSDNRQQEISDISRGLKILAKELGIPVVACSQLSRAADSRKPPKPILSDLRASGAIEQDADVVMFLYRDQYYNRDSEEKNRSEVIIAKQRNGPVGSVYLAFLAELTRFVNLPDVDMHHTPPPG